MLFIIETSGGTGKQAGSREGSKAAGSSRTERGATMRSRTRTCPMSPPMGSEPRCVNAASPEVSLMVSPPHPPSARAEMRPREFMPPPEHR